MKILAAGIMSGTSLDGIDIALCCFLYQNKKWTYEIIDAQTINYDDSWKKKLATAPERDVENFLLLHNEYGTLTGNLVTEFLKGKEVPQLIASHGHTIFHQPERNFTFQIGNGATIAATTNITTISDFRSFDVALGGQGAPLVPIGDLLLFSEFDYCLNLGGISNISFDQNGKRIASDISPVNIVLNNLAQQKGLPFDEDGKLGLSGKIDFNLLQKLNELDYYKLNGPKSLGREWIENYVNPLLRSSGIPIEDQAATIYEHIAYQFKVLNLNKGKMLVTGGGAKNKYLIEKLKRSCGCEIILPDEKLIDFKEALIFAFLGVLAFSGKNNIYSSITGARHDHIGGAVYYANW